MYCQKVEYNSLNSRQKETRNFHVLAGKLAEYGFECIRINDDWEGADFLAWNMRDDVVLKVQLKGRPMIARKYEDADLWMAFPVNDNWYLIEHDELKAWAKSETNVLDTKSWERGAYSWPRPSKSMLDKLKPCLID